MISKYLIELCLLGIENPEFGIFNFSEKRNTDMINVKNTDIRKKEIEKMI